MATQNTVKIGVDVSDNGTAKKTIKNVEELHSTIKKTQATAEKGISIGGTPGSRSVAAGYKPSAAAAAAQPTGSAEIAQYGQLRGSAGVTGASARDFANQAQGLGGLVRLYATYAANIFAVGAAFRALSSAMDTTNMVKGLDQLGAASGTALGSLSKRFASVTEGAVSLREAMEAVTKASSSGLGDTDILRIATSAKQASQALGVDMSDAVSRLTRGITKLEPELLDELGIFVRVDTAVAEYAKSVGKSASSLTDFERRMAFANATLDQAEKKFGEIKLDTNPYTQLLATVRDVSQNVLELVNVGLAPLVKILSSSPTALLAVLGGLGVRLVKQAIPALSDYRKSLQEMSEAAKESAKNRLQDLKSSLSEELSEKVKALDAIAQAEAESFDEASERLAASSKKIKKYDTRAFQISQKELNNITEEEIKYLEELGGKGKKISATYSDMALNLRNYIEAEKQHNAARAEQNTLLAKGSPLWTTIGQNELEYHTQVNDARKRSMVSSTAYTASTKGLFAGLSESWANFKSAGNDVTTTIDILDTAGKRTGATFSVVTGKIGFFSRAMLLAKLTTVSTVAALGTAVNAFMPWIQAIGTAIALGGAFISWMSSNTKETQKFNESIDRSSEAINTLNESLDFINKKPFGQQFSTESLEARAKAFMEVGASVEELVNSFNKATKAAGALDNAVEWVKSLWGGDIASKLSQSLSDTLVLGLNKAANTAAGSEARKKIANLLKLDPKFTEAELNRAISALDKGSPVFKDVINVFKQLGIEQGIVASRSRELDTAISASSEAYKTILDQFKSKDPLSILGENLVDTSQKLAEAFKIPETALQKLSEIASDPEKFKFFDAKDQALLIQYSSQLNTVNKNIDEQTRAVSRLKEERNKAVAELELLGKRSNPEYQYGKDQSEDIRLSVSNREFNKRLAEANKREAELAKAETNLAKARNESQALLDKFPNIVSNQLEKGANLISIGITASMSKASTIFKETVLSSIGSFPGVAKAREQIELSKIASDKSLLQVQQELVRVTMENTVATQIATAKQDLEDRNAEAREAKFTGGTRERADAARQRVAELELKLKIVQTDPKQVQSTIRQVVDQVKSGNKELAADSKNILSYLNGLAGTSAQIAAKDQEARAVKYRTILETTKEELEVKKRAISNERESLNINQQKLSDLETINGFSTETLATQIGINAQRSIELGFEEKLLDIDQKRKALMQAQKTGVTGLSDVEFNKELDRLTEEADTLKKGKFQQLDSQRLQTNKKILEIRLQEIARTSELSARQNELNNILEDTKRLSSDIGLEQAEQTELYTTKYLASLKTAKELRDVELSARRSTEQESNALARKREENFEKLAELELSGATEAATRLRTQMEMDQSLHSARLAQIEEEKRLRLMSIDEIAKYREEKEDYTKFIESIKNLDVVWQGVGSSLAAVVEAQTNATKSREQYAKTIKDMEFERDAASTAKEKLSWQQKIDKATADSRKEELNSASKLAGATKNLFKEKTAAYKAFAATEKVLQAASLALEVKTVLTKMGLWAAEVPAKAATETAKVSIEQTAAAASAPTTYAGIVGRYLNDIPAPWGMVAGLAAGAFFLSLLGGGGGKKGPSTFAPTSAQIQETQGTGMAWNAAGEKVADIGGILGDDEAKANSIVNSLEILKDNSFKSLDYDNKLLRSFQNLADALATTTNTILTSGLRTIPTSILQTLGSRTEAGFGADIPIIGGILSGIFGGGYSESRNIQSQRLELRGNFDSLANDMASGLRQVTDILVQWQEDGGWFGDDDSGSYIESIVGTVPEDVINSFQSVFNYLREGYQEIAQQLKKEDPIAFVASKLQNLMLVDSQGNPLKFDYAGLKGDEIRAELEAYFSKINNIALKALFPEFSKFETAGEDYGTTVIKVIQSTNQVRLALMSMGSAFDLTRSYLLQTVETPYDIATALTKAAGGLENFVDQVNFFSQNFLTEAERLAPIQKAIVEELTRLGYSSITTRSQFKQLVQGLDLSTEAGRQNYQSLMDLAEGFSLVTEATETALSATIDKFKKFAEDLKSFRDNLVLGSSSILTPLQKYAEAKLQFEDTYTKALAGDEKAQGKLTGSAQAFLTASKDYFASSSAYTQDFNNVLDKVGVGITGAEEQISIAEMQLNGITTQVGLLTQINENIAYIAGVPQAARGGSVRGLTFVGEKGPELVDFTSPARVYTAEQTAGMFSPQPGISSNMTQVVMELKQVKQELSQLRKEQQQQTGDLIVSNYDANNKAAQSIAQEVTNTNTNAEWQQRNKVVVV